MKKSCSSLLAPPLKKITIRNKTLIEPTQQGSLNPCTLSKGSIGDSEITFERGIFHPEKDPSACRSPHIIAWMDDSNVASIVSMGSVELDL